ncbi:hypothetical protein [Actinoalloteichus spitiensis]|uniref:hypothetical protein n=1 Tax=Actinoalloteichus spitiensis TaxID=252394 RepID=UPI0002EF9CAD|nr:hypothetical protein [Actinoalloteichus spitiensis]
MWRDRRAGHDEEFTEFTEFTEARFGRMHRVAYALCGDWLTAEELTQAAFVPHQLHARDLVDAQPTGELPLTTPEIARLAEYLAENG